MCAAIMVKIVDMDEKVTLSTQLEGDVDGGGNGAVILLNKFTIQPDDVDEFLKVFQATTKVMKQQPGFISAQLHRGIAGSSTFFNYMLFLSLQNTLNVLLTLLNFGQVWLAFHPTLRCLPIYSRKLQCQISVWID
jgi:hypothetical protein